MSIALLVLCAAATTTRSQAAAPSPQSGIFVSYNLEAERASVTIQQSGRPAVFVLAPAAVAREHAAGEPWQTVPLSALAPGEPVILHIGDDGRVQMVDAEFTNVLTRLVILTKGYVITTSGESYKLIGKAAEAATSLELGTYLKLRVDPQGATAFDIATASQPFTSGNQGQLVTVTFVVTVPPNTPPSDIVYIASSIADWTANGERMSPLTGNRWTETMMLGSGSVLQYRYTRGSWATDERNAAGVEIPNRTLSVTKTGLTQTVNDTVVRWADLSS